MSFRRAAVFVAVLTAGAAMAQGAVAAQPSTSSSSTATAKSASAYTFDAAKGKAAYGSTCAACHQANGEGIPGTFPPLKGNPAVTNDDPTLQLHTIIHGAHGTKIDGKTYAGVMPPFGSQFSDVQIADIANHERTSWGNHAKHVTPAQVAAVRAGKTATAAASGGAATAKPAGTQSAAAAKPAAVAYKFNAAEGKKLFDGTCAACHQATGVGIPGTFPPLKGNPSVDNPDPTLQLHTIIHGAHGTKIDGKTYAGVMPPFGSQFSDVQIANIANHERTSWGNHAKLVTPQDVAKVRGKAKPAAAASATAAPAKAPATSATATTTATTKLGPLSGNPAAGKTKIAVCSACHGKDGNSTSPEFPKLAGQNEHYIVEQLENFKSGRRKNAIMQGMAAPLSEQDMHDIAAYFASQKVTPGVADPKLAVAGGKLFRGGDASRDIPACMSCHGPDGRGNPGAPYPQIAGQHAQYVTQVLTAWHDGDTWGTSKHAQIMPSIAKRLTKQDIAEVASYIQGLHTNTGAVQAK